MSDLFFIHQSGNNDSCQLRHQYLIYISITLCIFSRTFLSIPLSRTKKCK